MILIYTFHKKNIFMYGYIICIAKSEARRNLNKNLTFSLLNVWADTYVLIVMRENIIQYNPIQSFLLFS